MRKDDDPDTDPVASGATMTPSQAIGLVATSAASSLAAPEPSTGRLPERYQLGSRLGAGGMGEVLLATDQQIGREVAIKRMLVAASASATARFVREAKIQGRLEHPAIVPVHELANDGDGRPFFVMKKLAGTTLADVIVSPGRFSRQKLLRAFADVCLAIEFAHQRGIVHRDLKPANIMLGDFGEVYVLDWGIARILDETDDVEPHSPAFAGSSQLGPSAPSRPSRPDATEIGAILGTPGYIAPELLRGLSLDGRADVYALGCILFEILAGQPLLPRGRDALTAALEPIEARPSMRAPDRDIPPELDALCLDATRVDRETRLPNARVVAERIEQFLDGDRDMALRKTLAASHLDTARGALASGDGETERATAMREAGRAIALDPTSSAAAELVSRLMLEPPREVPREVDQRVEQLAEDAARAKAGVLTFVILGFLAFIPILVWMGVRDPNQLVVFAIGVSLDGLFTFFVLRRRRAVTVTHVHIAAAVHAITIVVIARQYSPFFIAPGLTALSVLLFGIDPRVRWRAITMLSIAGVLAPWILELTGVWSRTIGATSGGDLVLHSTAVMIHLPEAEIGLAVYVVFLIAVAGYLARRLALTQQATLRSLELQSWHLRQLVGR